MTVLLTKVNLSNGEWEFQEPKWLVSRDKKNETVIVECSPKQSHFVEFFWNSDYLSKFIWNHGVLPAVRLELTTHTATITLTNSTPENLVWITLTGPAHGVSRNPSHQHVFILGFSQVEALRRLISEARSHISNKRYGTSR